MKEKAKKLIHFGFDFNTTASELRNNCRSHLTLIEFLPKGTVTVRGFVHEKPGHPQKLGTN